MAIEDKRLEYRLSQMDILPDFMVRGIGVVATKFLDIADRTIVSYFGPAEELPSETSHEEITHAR